MNKNTLDKHALFSFETLTNKLFTKILTDKLKKQLSGSEIVSNVGSQSEIVADQNNASVSNFQ